MDWERLLEDLKVVKWMALTLLVMITIGEVVIFFNPLSLEYEFGYYIFLYWITFPGLLFIIVIISKIRERYDI